MSTPLNAPDDSSPATTHRFTLGDWHHKASVRSSPSTYQLEDDIERQLETRDWFPPAFLPYLRHPTLAGAAPSIRHRLTANHLVYFLDYTTVLELQVVNRSVATLIHRQLGIIIPERMKTAALQLYTDEGYHALFSNQLAEQIARRYAIAYRPATPRRIERLLALIENIHESYKAHGWFLLGFISETIIARELLSVPRDSLVSSVQQMLTDHLADEARHSRYFCEVFSYLWLTLNNRQRLFTARFLLDAIQVFFEIDEQWLSKSLQSVNLPSASITEIINAHAGEDMMLQRARSGAEATLGALKKAGFFNLPYNQRLFIKAGLIDG
ncbi:P-aminobenzoate N-oxygenase AurF [Pseudomonas sp. ok272]|uniref:diiron oxygenase n=1 Tax=unclassified Pseudomonas TaxID=196821 RepID=UPI0008B0E1ED|nr:MULTISPECIES: diiron oxygenase [unclassified Pseudomonas]SEM82065.1 P-aminobenzoate N-oxygenase AurF [Pseudomonas sp. ok272]SFM66405.1 P-aminobenzoate N-oxygenase AurF [Pseudomonas sp. ok602]